MAVRTRVEKRSATLGSKSTLTGSVRRRRVGSISFPQGLPARQILISAAFTQASPQKGAEVI